jgi:hypothetical protein
VARWLLSDHLRSCGEDDAAAFGFNLYLAPRAAFVRFDLSGGEIDARYVSYLQRPGAQYVVLREATVRRFTDRLSLAERGFSPVDTGMQGNMWRVYVRRGP